MEPLCLPRNPEWGIYRDGTDGYKAYVYGAEYVTSDLSDKWPKLHNHDVPCAVCLVRNRSVVKMFPGKSAYWFLMPYEMIFNTVNCFHRHKYWCKRMIKYVIFYLYFLPGDY